MVLCGHMMIHYPITKFINQKQNMDLILCRNENNLSRQFEF